MSRKKKNANNPSTAAVKEGQRRCSGTVCQELGLSRATILSIMDKHNRDVITVGEARRWVRSAGVTDTNDVVSDPLGLDILAAIVVHKAEMELNNKIARENEQIQKLRRELHERDAQYHRDKFLNDLLAKLQVNPRLPLSGKEFDEMEEMEWYFYKDNTGISPRELCALTEEDPWVKVLVERLKINPEDHATFPSHMSQCDGSGKDVSCEERISQLRKEQKDHARYVSGMKEIEVLTNGIDVGDVVLCSWDRKLGLVTKINKISYRLKIVGSWSERGMLTEARFSPKFVTKVNVDDYTVPTVGDKVRVLCPDARVREAEVLEVVDHFFLATWRLKSNPKEIRTAWMDPLAIKNAYEKENPILGPVRPAKIYKNGEQRDRFHVSMDAKVVACHDYDCPMGDHYAEYLQAWNFAVAKRGRKNP